MGLGGSLTIMARPKQLTPEMLVPRLGDYLVEKGIITQEQLESALQYQIEHRDEADSGHLLGGILVKMNILTRSQLDEAVTEQILHLRAALEENNRELERRVKDRTAELERAMNKLAELNQLKSNFVANISHELRTPLTHVKGYLELLLSGDLGKTSPEQNHALDTMQRATQRLERLIEDLILFSTSEHGQVNLRLLTFDLVHLAETIVRQYQQAAKEHKVTLTLEKDEDLPLVNADAEKITWVIQQLLDNAIKFTPPKGQVRIVLTGTPDAVRCTIADSGIGIPQERIEEIFEPFHQLDSSSTRKYGGTGLGLSLAKKIIEAHNSTIQVHSKVGQGSQLSFQLKVARDSS